ncbi:MAG: hypothetical protein NTW80_01250, partial [Deltaproteobacteria bacterium]|nr:hypothetical protein [Deltaproteobacteria bacterium]
IGVRLRPDGRDVDSTLFRNNGDIHPDSSGNKETCSSNDPGFKRHKCGAICGKPQSGETG